VSSSGGRRSGGAADVVYGLLVRGLPIVVRGGFVSREVSFNIEKQGKEDEESSAGASPSRKRRTSINGSLNFDGRQFQDAQSADQQIDLQALVESQSGSSTVPQRRTPSRTSRLRVSNPPSPSPQAVQPLRPEESGELLSVAPPEACATPKTLANGTKRVHLPKKRALIVVGRRMPTTPLGDSGRATRHTKSPDEPANLCLLRARY
jgi:hypothetical protein